MEEKGNNEKGNSSNESTVAKIVNNFGKEKDANFHTALLQRLFKIAPPYTARRSQKGPDGTSLGLYKKRDPNAGKKWTDQDVPLAYRPFLINKEHLTPVDFLFHLAETIPDHERSIVFDHVIYHILLHSTFGEETIVTSIVSRIVGWPTLYNDVESPYQIAMFFPEQNGILEFRRLAHLLFLRRNPNLQENLDRITAAGLDLKLTVPDSPDSLKLFIERLFDWHLKKKETPKTIASPPPTVTREEIHAKVAKYKNSPRQKNQNTVTETEKTSPPPAPQ